MKLNVYEIYKAMFKALMKVYTGDIYLVLESIHVVLDDTEPNEIMALEPYAYTVYGRYGREGENAFNTRFSQFFQAEYTPEQIEVLFYEYLMKK